MNQKLHNHSMRTLTVLCAAALAALAVACQKDDNTVDLTAVVADRPDSGAKVYIDGLYGCWQQGDAVKIHNGSSADNYSLAVASADGVTATISGVAQGDSYTAGYPAANTTVSGPGALAIELPAVQTYESAAISGDAGDAAQRIVSPMAAYSTGDILKFYNVGALLKVVVSNTLSEALTLYAVEVESDNAPLSGIAAVTATAKGASISTVSGTGKSVTLSLSGAGVTLDASTGSDTLYIPVLPIAENAKSNLTVHVKATGASGKYTFHGESAAAEGVWIAQNQIGTVPVTLDEEGKTSVDAYFWGKGTEECPFIIETEEDLYNLRTLTNNATSRYCGDSVYYLQAADLDISSQTNWGSSSNYAVGNSTNSFKANYDGDNHFVKLNIVSCSTANDTYGYALFGIAGNSNTIKNLTVKGSVASNDRMGVLGGLVGRVTGSMTFENCTNEATITSTYGTTTLDKFGFGGICGIVNANGCDVVFRNCTNQGTITEKQNCAGGICGNIISCNSCKFINCRNGLDKNKITDYKISSTNGSYIGGICGYVQKATTPVEFNSCYNNYSLNNTRYVGGILGYAKSECVFMSCHNYKSITATATDKTSYCGGIIGYSSAALSFSRGNTNEANLIVGGSNVGGIVGYINGGLLTISDSARNSGNIVSSASPAASSNRGGIVGYAYSGVDLTNCKNTGTVAGNQYLAGIVGWLGTKCTMNGCSNENTIQQTETSALSNIGGLIGFASGVTGGFIVKNCYNTGDITGKSICGGLIGYLYFSSSPNSIYTNIYNCYCSNCNITATSSNSYAGGIIGQYRTGGTSYYNLAIHNCYVSPTMTSGSGVYKGVLFGTYNSSYKAYTENNYYASTMGATAKQGASSSSTIAFNTADYSISSTTINGNPYTDVVDALNAARNAIVEGTSLYTGQSSLSLADLKGWKESNGEIVFN